MFLSFHRIPTSQIGGFIPLLASKQTILSARSGKSGTWNVAPRLRGKRAGQKEEVAETELGARPVPAAAKTASQHTRISTLE